MEIWMPAGGTLTKAGLAEALRREVGISQRDAHGIVGALLEHICRALEKGENVKIGGFGSFVVRHKKERAGRNPKSGAEARIPARRVLTFRASQQMRDRIAKTGQGSTTPRR